MVILSISLSYLKLEIFSKNRLFNFSLELESKQNLKEIFISDSRTKVDYQIIDLDCRVCYPFQGSILVLGMYSISNPMPVVNFFLFFTHSTFQNQGDTIWHSLKRVQLRIQTEACKAE